MGEVEPVIDRWIGVGSNARVVPDHRGEEGGEPGGGPLDLPVDPRFSAFMRRKDGDGVRQERRDL